MRTLDECMKTGIHEEHNHEFNVRLLEALEYTDIRYIETMGYCGLLKFLFYTGLCVNLNPSAYGSPYSYYYSFNCPIDAKIALDKLVPNQWPEGAWIKRKSGIHPEVHNPDSSDPYAIKGDYVLI